MEYQKKILGVVFIIAGAMLIVILTLISSLIFAFPVDSIFHSEFHPGRNAGMDLPGVFRIISLAGSIMLALLLAFPSIIVGIGLVRQKRWANDLVLPLGCFYLLFFPLGTAIGIYGLLVFFANRPDNNRPSTPTIDTQTSVR